MTAIRMRVCSKLKFFLDVLLRKRKLVLGICFMLLTVSAFFVFTSPSYKREVRYLNDFIHEYVTTNRYRNISEPEIAILAEKLHYVSKKYDMDPKLIISVIIVESGFNTNAVSHMGARGLMQLLPATARFVAEDLGLDYNCYSELSDIRKNVLLGTHYLYTLAERYDRNKDMFLTAYNFGPENVDRMLREQGRIPLGYASKIINIYKELSL